MSSLVAAIDRVKEAAKHQWTDKQQTDFDFWEKWKDGGQKPDDLRPLLHRFKGMIRKRANHWATQADLPKATVHAEFNRQFLNAAKTYNPTKGAALGSWVYDRLRKAQRFVVNYQDPTRVQEQRYYNIGKFQNAKATMNDQLGREPSSRELSELLGWSENEIGRMESEMRGVLFSSSFEYDPTSIMPSREAEVLRLVRYQLSPEELSVYDYRTGGHGKPQLKPADIAKQLGITQSRVYRVLNKIGKAIDQNLGK